MTQKKELPKEMENKKIYDAAYHKEHKENLAKLIKLKVAKGISNDYREIEEINLDYPCDLEEDTVAKKQQSIPKMTESGYNEFTKCLYVDEHCDMDEIIDLSSVWNHMIKIFPKRGAKCSFGFKGYDLKDDSSTPIVRFYPKDSFFILNSELLKEIRLNTEQTIGAITFDIDIPYDKYKPVLMDLITSGLIPEPTYIIIRKGTRRFHIVYLLDKRYYTHDSINQDALNSIRTYFTEVLKSDVAYNNTFMHNPFYEYSTYEKRYFSTDSRGYIVVPSPINSDGTIPNKKKLELITYPLWQLSYYHARAIEAYQQDEMGKHMIGLFNTPENKKNGKVLSLFLNDVGLKRYNELFKTPLEQIDDTYQGKKKDIVETKQTKVTAKKRPKKKNEENDLISDEQSHVSNGNVLEVPTVKNASELNCVIDIAMKTVFQTGPNFRNNTLWYNAMAILNAKKGRITSLESLCDYVEECYITHYKSYENPKAGKPAMTKSELNAIAQSAWNYHKRDVNHIFFPRAWDGSDIDDWGKKPSERKFKENQKRRSKRSAEVRRQQKEQRQEQLSKLLEQRYWADLSLTDLKYHAAKHFCCSEKTIERDLQCIKRKKETQFMSFNNFIKDCKYAVMQNNDNIKCNPDNRNQIVSITFNQAEPVKCNDLLPLAKSQTSIPVIKSYLEQGCIDINIKESENYNNDKCRIEQKCNNSIVLNKKSFQRFILHSKPSVFKNDIISLFVNYGIATKMNNPPLRI